MGTLAVRLQQRFRVIRFDLPGHGLTGPGPAGADRPTAHAALVERLRVRLGIDRMTLAGSSTGGGVAWRYALAHPERLTRLVLVAAEGYPDPGAPAAPLPFRLLRLPILRDLATVVTPRFLVEAGMQAAFHNRAKLSPAAVDRTWELLRYPGNRRAMVESFARPSNDGTPAEMRRIRVPTLILWGAHDNELPVRSASWFIRHIPDARLVIYSDSGHAPMEEQPDASASDVGKFMERLSR